MQQQQMTKMPTSCDKTPTNNTQTRKNSLHTKNICIIINITYNVRTVFNYHDILVHLNTGCNSKTMFTELFN
jgi:hypothetical protein